MRVDEAAAETRSGADGDANTVAGGTLAAVEPRADVVQTEGAASETGARGALAAPGIVARLFTEGAEPREAALSEVAALAADDAHFVWVDLGGYGVADLETVARELDLPGPGVRIALAAWTRPRVSVFGECFFVAVTVPVGDAASQRVLASELDLFVGRNYLVSAHKRPLPFADRVLARARQNPGLLTLDSAFLLSILLDELLAHYEEMTEGLEDEIEALEEQALVDVSDAFLGDLLRQKRYVFAVYRLASQHQPIVEAFLRPDFPLVGGEAIEPYFRDLVARLERLVDGLDAAKESVNGAFEIYVSQVSHRTNAIMKVLAIVSTLLLPATVILGFFGTNFEAPRFSTLAGFVAMIASIVLITVGSLVLFYRWGWIGRVAARTADRPGRAVRDHVVPRAGG
jgi:magnesium transporter